MSYVYINREIYPNQLVQDDPLDDNYAKGYSYDDYSKGNPAPWIELGEEQLAFKEANPKATVKEIIEAKLDDSRLLNEEKSAKYTAAGKSTANGAVIADDPGATGEFVWSISIADVPANVTVEELVATLTVTAAGGQKAQVTITQAAGDSTLELDKEVINLDVNGTAQTVNVTANDQWTWAQAAKMTAMKMMRSMGL